MPSSYSFDVVSDYDRQELVNAIDQVQRDVSQRYDLKDSDSEISLEDDEIIIITDADGTYPFDIIPEIIEAMKFNDMVVGSRTGASVKIPLIRRPAKWFINKLANYLSGTKIPDINSGLRAIKTNLVNKYINSNSASNTPKRKSPMLIKSSIF